MEKLIFRETQEKDIGPTLVVRASTRENPVSLAQLEQMGFARESVWDKYSRGEYSGWVCEDRGEIVGFISGDLSTGEVIVLSCRNTKEW